MRRVGGDHGSAVRLIRGALLTALIAGVVGLHVLTGGHDGGGFGSLPVPSAAHQSIDAAAPAVAAQGAPAGSGWGADEACVLFLIIGTTLLTLVVSRQRAAPGGRTGRVPERSCPPRSPPAALLCVMRA